MTQCAIAWQTLAKAAAYDAWLNYFYSRRGHWRYNEEQVIIYYNNHPYEGFPTLRDEETNELRRRMAAEGYPELGYATYSTTEDGRGYTLALIIGCNERCNLTQLSEWVTKQFEEILAATVTTICSAAATRSIL